MENAYYRPTYGAQFVGPFRRAALASAHVPILNRAHQLLTWMPCACWTRAVERHICMHRVSSANSRAAHACTQHTHFSMPGKSDSLLLLVYSVLQSSYLGFSKCFENVIERLNQHEYMSCLVAWALCTIHTSYPTTHSSPVL